MNVESIVFFRRYFGKMYEVSKDNDFVTRVNAERYGYFGKKYEVQKGNDFVTRVNVESIVFFRKISVM